MSRRKRIDWEKEMQKTEEIRRRGFMTSILGFVAAALVIFGASRINNDESILRPVVMVGCIFAAIIILVFTLKRRAKRMKKIRDEGNKESE